MEKRVERNKQLYKEVNKKIADIAKKNSNKEFESTNNTLKSINPGLFGGEKVEVNETKDNSHKTKIITTAIVFSILAVLIITLAVVIYYASK